MKLDCVLTACDMNPLYYDFIPMFIKAWNKLYPTVDVKIILINDVFPADKESYKDNIILFKKLKGVSTAFTAQYIRLLYPCLLNYENGIMITDVDSIPMNKVFFTENIKYIDNSKWINLRDWRLHGQIGMMGQIANSGTWKEVFKIRTIDDVNNRLISVNNKINYIDGKKDVGWSTDQLHLYKFVMHWNKKTGNYMHLKDRDTKFRRLDRSRFNMNKQVKRNIQSGFYSDYHCCRPYQKYKLRNDYVLDLLNQELKEKIGGNVDIIWFVIKDCIGIILFWISEAKRFLQNVQFSK